MGCIGDEVVMGGSGEEKGGMVEEVGRGLVGWMGVQ